MIFKKEVCPTGSHCFYSISFESLLVKFYRTVPACPNAERSDGPGSEALAPLNLGHHFAHWMFIAHRRRSFLLQLSPAPHSQTSFLAARSEYPHAELLH